MAKEFSEEKDESLEMSSSPDSGETDLQTENGSENGSETEPDPLTQCKEDLATEKDQRLRVVAEFANYRRRMENQRVDWSHRARAGVIRTLLPVIDDLERSLSVAEGAASDDNAFLSLQSGISLVRDNFMSELEKLGLKRIQSVGKAFDEDLHEAVGQAPASDGEEDGQVLFESQAGYRLADQVLRHAQVIVATVQAPPVPVEADTQ